MTQPQENAKDRRYNAVSTAVVGLLSLGAAVVTAVAVVPTGGKYVLPVMAALGAMGAFIQLCRFFYEAMSQRREVAFLDALGWGLVFTAAVVTSVYGFAHP